jgi:hypothetical protein
MCHNPVSDRSKEVFTRSPRQRGRAGIRNLEAERLGRLEVDDKFVLRMLSS